jgi:hypothetical protein
MSGMNWRRVHFDKRIHANGATDAGLNDRVAFWRKLRRAERKARRKAKREVERRKQNTRRMMLSLNSLEKNTT